MEKDKQDYVDGVLLWIKGQRILVAQLESNTAYNEKEIDLHQQSIDNDTAMLKHYATGIEQAEAELQKYLTDNPSLMIREV